jgi:hypothetical protein
LAKAGATVERVARAAEKSLHRTLSDIDGGGCPGLHELIDVVEQLAHAYHRGSLFYSVPIVRTEARRAATARLQSIEESWEHHPHTSLAAEVARSACIAIGHGAPAFQESTAIAHQVAEEFGRRVVEHHLFAPLRPIVSRERGMSLDAVRTWERSVLDSMAPYLGKTGTWLLQDATGAKMKRPTRRSMGKVKTADLLGINLLKV